ncbi:hypothetical protein CWATWH0003_2890 [Crocosphaera watsonii WH 0003]|uniref:DUF2949 domain-containing protein n=1 Tax=Crocosphaera watsonii WH 0003 TaxID=423471 RepID=G5J5Y5_CROWT|nr:hypothetical protein CWATWH0003_2890 [Crocosphaera watsonii WH 0003]
MQQEMALSRDDLAVVIKNRRQPGDPIPMLLWQYGLISLGELQRIWDWLDAQIQFQAP